MLMNTHSVLYTVVSVVLLTGKALLLAGNLNVKTFELKASASPFFFGANGGCNTFIPHDFHYLHCSLLYTALP